MNRPYESSIRAEQAEATRQRIIDNAVERLSSGDTTWSMQDVADAAGVSVRTVYRHFATREDLIDGVLTWINQTIIERRPQLTIATAEDLAESAPSAFRVIHQNIDLYRVLLFTEFGRERHARTKGRREEEIAAGLKDELAGLGKGARVRLMAVVHALASSQTALLMHDLWGLGADEAGRTVGWAIRVLAAAAADDDWKKEL